MIRINKNVPKTWKASWIMREIASSQVNTCVALMVVLHRFIYPAIGRLRELVWQYAANPITALQSFVYSFSGSLVIYIIKSDSIPAPCAELEHVPGSLSDVHISSEFNNESSIIAPVSPQFATSNSLHLAALAPDVHLCPLSLHVLSKVKAPSTVYCILYIGHNDVRG